MTHFHNLKKNSTKLTMHFVLLFVAEQTEGET